MVKGTKDWRWLSDAPLIRLWVDLLNGFSDGSAGMVLFACDLPYTLFLKVVCSANGFVVFHDNHLRSLLSLAGTFHALTIAEKTRGWVPFALSKLYHLGPVSIVQTGPSGTQLH